MSSEQNWRTEYYRGFDVSVSAIPKDQSRRSWDYTLRITEPGADSSTESELTSESGDDDDYSSEEAAVEAGFAKAYAMVDALLE